MDAYIEQSDKVYTCFGSQTKLVYDPVTSVMSHLHPQRQLAMTCDYSRVSIVFLLRHHR